MEKMKKGLEAGGYRVLNIGYASRKHPIETLAKQVRQRILGEMGDVGADGDEPLFFVTHSLGGILVRWLQQHDPLENVQRMVMLSPPNHGSEVVDALGGWKLFKWLNGPAGSQLGSDPDGFIGRLGPPNFEVGVITGDRSINLVLSTFLPGKDDGKVTVESARLEGMRDFLIVPTSHPYIMKNSRVISATRRFLDQGRFADEPSS